MSPSLCDSERSDLVVHVGTVVLEVEAFHFLSNLVYVWLADESAKGTLKVIIFENIHRIAGWECVR